MNCGPAPGRPALVGAPRPWPRPRRRARPGPGAAQHGEVKVRAPTRVARAAGGVAAGAAETRRGRARARVGAGCRLAARWARPEEAERCREVLIQRRLVEAALQPTRRLPRHHDGVEREWPTETARGPGEQGWRPTRRRDHRPRTAYALGVVVVVFAAWRREDLITGAGIDGGGAVDPLAAGDGRRTAGRWGAGGWPRCAPCCARGRPVARCCLLLLIQKKKKKKKNSTDRAWEN